jgi:hypothetical protein
MIMPGCSGSIVTCKSMQTSQPAETMSNAVRIDLVNAFGDNNCYINSYL